MLAEHPDTADMKVTWIIPDTYGFLVDELECLSERLESIRVLSGTSVPPAVRERLAKVEIHACPEESLWSSAPKRQLGMRLARIHGWRRVLTSGWHTRKIAGVYNRLLRLESEAPSDVIHSHFAHPGGIGGWLAPGAGQVLTLRGYDILTTGRYGSLWNPFFRKNLLHFFQKNGIVTAGSGFSALRARQILGSSADIRFLKQGLTRVSFQPAGQYSRASLGIPEDAVVLVSVGNLVEVKNHELLLKAFAEIRATRQCAMRLLICGEGSLKASLVRLGESLGLGDDIRFLGKFSREELTDIYGLSDLLVHTSMSEGFGNVILEAMLHRLFVVASPVGVAPDVIRHGENGFLPLLGDKESWVCCLQEALERLPSFDTAREANRKLVMEEFTMERRIDGFVALYQEAIRTKSRANTDA